MHQPPPLFETQTENKTVNPSLVHYTRDAHPLNALVALVVVSHSVCVLVVVLLLGGHRVTVQVALRIRALTPFVFLFVQSLLKKKQEVHNLLSFNKRLVLSLNHSIIN